MGKEVPYVLFQPVGKDYEMKIGIIGYGIVGKATEVTLRRWHDYDFDLVVHDIKFVGSSNETMRKTMKDCKYIFICLPTPPTPDGKCDIRFIDEAVQNLSTCEGTIIIRSSVPPMTCDILSERYSREILFMPEFLTEKKFWYDAENPEFIIIGGQAEAVYAMDELFSKFPSELRFIIPKRDAELLKYSMNCFFSTKVVFANAMYDVATTVGASWDSVREIMQLHPFVGKNHFDVFHGGFRGYGGKCLPKDTKAIAYGFNSKFFAFIDKYNEELTKNG